MAWCRNAPSHYMNQPPISLERDQFDGYGVICTAQYDSLNSSRPSDA